MDEPELLCTKIEHFPQDVIDHYKLKEKVDEEGNLYVQVEKECMVCPRQVFSLTNYWKKDYTNLNTDRVTPRQDFGNTYGAQVALR